MLVADVAVPGESGYQLLARVRSLPDQGGRTPAVALARSPAPATGSGRYARASRCTLSKPGGTTSWLSVLAELVASATTWKARVGVRTAPGLA